jgi:hypothetical protein
MPAPQAPRAESKAPDRLQPSTTVKQRNGAPQAPRKGELAHRPEKSPIDPSLLPAFLLRPVILPEKTEARPATRTRKKTSEPAE